MENQIIPTKIGQICTINNDIADDVYIITEEPSSVLSEGNITVVKLKDLQRNISDPSQAKRIKVRKDTLFVVAADLEDYVKSFNI